MVSIVPRCVQPTSARWQLPCDHERMLGGGCTGLAMAGADLSMSPAYAPPKCMKPVAERALSCKMVENVNCWLVLANVCYSMG